MPVPPVPPARRVMREVEDDATRRGMTGKEMGLRLSRMGITQVELARIMGVDPGAVGEMMRSPDVPTGTLEGVCGALHLPMSFFYDDLGAAVAAGSVVPSDAGRAVEGGVARMWETGGLGDKVRTLLKGQRKRMSALCRYVGMTDPGLRRAFERDSCNIAVLVKVAEFFGVPVAYFLPEDARAREAGEKDREIQYLRGLLEAYEAAIAAVASGSVVGGGSLSPSTEASTG